MSAAENIAPHPYTVSDNSAATAAVAPHSGKMI